MSGGCKLQSLIYLRLAKAFARRSGVHYSNVPSRNGLENTSALLKMMVRTKGKEREKAKALYKRTIEEWPRESKYLLKMMVRTKGKEREKDKALYKRTIEEWPRE